MGATGAGEAWFGGVEAGKVFEVGWCGWDSHGLDLDTVWVVLESLTGVEVIQGELEVWWEAVCSHIVVSRARYDMCVDMVEVDGGCGKSKVLWVGAQYRCVCGELAGEFRKLVWVEV